MIAEATGKAEGKAIEDDDEDDDEDDSDDEDEEEEVVLPPKEPTPPPPAAEVKKVPPPLFSTMCPPASDQERCIPMQRPPQPRKDWLYGLCTSWIYSTQTCMSKTLCPS